MTVRSVFGRLAVVSALVGGMVLGVGVSAAVAATVYSPWRSWYSPVHVTRAYVTDASVYGGQVKRESGATSPAGYLGVTSRIYRGTTFCGTTGVAYNNNPVVVQIAYGSYRYDGYCSDASNFTAESSGAVYNTSTGKYNWAESLKSPAKALPAQ